MIRVNISIWLILLGLTIFSFIVAYVRAYIDERIIKKLWGKVKSLVHWTRASITFVILVVVGYIFWSKRLISEIKDFESIFDWGFYKPFIKYLCVISYQWFWYSFYFDIILNRMRGLNDWYVGQTSTMDIMVRKTFGMNSGRIYGIIKIILIIISAICIITLK